MKLNQIKYLAVFMLLLALGFSCSPAAETNYEIHRASTNMAKAFRQFQKADKAYYNGDNDACVNHLSKGLDHFEKALGHLEQAEEDTYKQAGNLIDKGDAELGKSIDEYESGNDESAQKHYANAMDYYDQALDLID